MNWPCKGSFARTICKSPFCQASM